MSTTTQGCPAPSYEMDVCREISPLPPVTTCEHSNTTSAVVQNAWDSTSIANMPSITWWLIKNTKQIYLQIILQKIKDILHCDIRNARNITSTTDVIKQMLYLEDVCILRYVTCCLFQKQRHFRKKKNPRNFIRAVEAGNGVMSFQTPWSWRT